LDVPYGWLFKDWPLDYHNFGTFRTGLGVVAHSSHNTMTINLKQLLSLGDICLCFSVIGCFQTSWYFPPKSHLIVIFFSFWNFWLPLHSRSVLYDYCSIKAALVQYQILLKEVMLNQKVVHYSGLVIKKTLNV